AVAAAISPPAFEEVALAVAIALFVGGCAVFLWAFFVAAGRSRTERLELAQVWFLTGPPTPPAVRRSLLAALAVQVVAGLATAAARPYTSLAAGVLIPMWGLGLCGLWAARHGTFPGIRSTDADQRDQDP
ncbi:MAG: hypothetical protein M3203_03785, partial [Actinomycetota bacterium]|nr:hypothetical protein [Actinomycetota bacterium]